MIFTHNSVQYKIDQETLDEDEEGGYYNILASPNQYNLSGTVNTATLDFVLLQLGDIWLKTVSDGGNLDLKIHDNDEGKDSITGVIEAWDLDETPDRLIQSYPVD